MAVSSSPSKQALQRVDDSINGASVTNVKLPYSSLGTEYTIYSTIYVGTVSTIKSPIFKIQSHAKHSPKLNISNWVFSTAFPFLCPLCPIHHTIRGWLYVQIFMKFSWLAMTQEKFLLVLNEFLPSVRPGRQQIEQVAGSRWESAGIGNYLRFYPKSFPPRRLLYFQGRKKSEKSKQIQIYFCEVQ